MAVIAYMAYSDFFAPQPDVSSLKQPQFSTAGVSGTLKSAEEKNSYVVPPSHPRELIINSLGIDANIVPVGTVKNNMLDAPKTAWDAGWYDQSALPGANTGALLIDGHVNDALNTPGIFFSLRTLKTNDEIKIERGDRQLFAYRVVLVEQMPAAQVDMGKLLRSITPEKEGLNLITCGGTYSKAQKTYDDRILVYAERM
jgi:LPXTG-site transpeptidase (sortase) family protein